MNRMYINSCQRMKFTGGMIEISYQRQTYMENVSYIVMMRYLIQRNGG
ncbi:MAG: hypothetical protein K2K70_10505 [Lachnospiraceae bacterium]|nr:hypothetical protein [Lachnospiraceae bacterium]